jgi:hypothetical protein
MRPVKTGELLTGCFLTSEVRDGNCEARRKYIKDAFKKNCECIACENNWNLFEEPRSVRHLIPVKWLLLEQYMMSISISPRLPNQRQTHSAMAKEVFVMLPFLLKHLPNREYAR